MNLEDYSDEKLRSAEVVVVNSITNLFTSFSFSWQVFISCSSTGTFIRGSTLTVLMVVLTVPIWLMSTVPSNHSSFDKRVWALEPKVASLFKATLRVRWLTVKYWLLILKETNSTLFYGYGISLDLVFVKLNGKNTTKTRVDEISEDGRHAS